MKSIFLTALLGLFAGHIHAQDMQSYERHWKKGVEKIRVIFWNIFNGGDTDYLSDHFPVAADFIRQTD